ncbi:MAG: transposase [Saprospiraceae bacterium]|nr:transposase [Saprospiraceae bacterium]
MPKHPSVVLQIIEYLGRYTHKVAISVNRIIAIDDQYITFKYKDYADRNLVKRDEYHIKNFYAGLSNTFYQRNL